MDRDRQTREITCTKNKLSAQSKASIVALNRRSILGLIFTLLRDLAKFNVSNCNVVANNRVYLLSYSVELFVVLQQRRLCVQSNAGDQQAPPHTGSPVRPCSGS